MKKILSLLFQISFIPILMGQSLPAGFDKIYLLSNYDSLFISGLVSYPETEPVAIVQLVHGMSEHKERYIPFMQYLNQKGYLCIIHDHRGHGQSIRQKDDLGYFYTGGYKAMIEDTRMVSRYIQNKYPAKKLYLIGHSMGSMVVRSYTKRYDKEIDGLIVIGCPVYNEGCVAGTALAKYAAQKKGDHYRPKKLQKLSFGAFNYNFQPVSSPNDWICSDPQVVAAYDKDSLCNFVFTANGFENLFLLMRDAYSKTRWVLSQPQLPIHFFSGEDDPCLITKRNFLSAVNLMKKVGYSQIGYTLYPGMRHEILNEKKKEIVYSDISNLLDQWRLR